MSNEYMQKLYLAAKTIFGEGCQIGG